MDVTFFDIEFTVRERIFKASCQKFQVHNYPQIRVVVDRRKKGYDIYIFYDEKDKTHHYVWYKLPDKRQDIATAIAKELEKADSA